MGQERSGSDWGKERGMEEVREWEAGRLRKGEWGREWVAESEAESERGRVIQGKEYQEVSEAGSEENLAANFFL